MGDGDVKIGEALHEPVGDGTILVCRRPWENVWRFEESDGQIVSELRGWSAFHVGREFQRELERRRAEIRFQ